MAWTIRRVRVDGKTLKVVQPGRLRIMREWQGRDIWVNFPVRGNWYLVQHDELVKAVGGKGTLPRLALLEAPRWVQHGTSERTPDGRTCGLPDPGHAECLSLSS